MTVPVRVAPIPVEGVDALRAEDVAECVRWVASRPARVNVDQMIVLARDQAGARQVHRRPT
jgi:NADP-dependent 3-hydroxy acid dehydrogenase YdfG